MRQSGCIGCHSMNSASDTMFSSHDAENTALSTDGKPHQMHAEGFGASSLG